MALLRVQHGTDASSRGQCLTVQGLVRLADRRELRKPAPGPPLQMYLVLPGERDSRLPVWALSALPRVLKGLGDPGPMEQEGPLPIILSSATQGMSRDK